MTREEAIQICKEVRHCLWIADEQKTTTIWDKGAVSEAMLMAIEALKAQDRPIICPRCGRTFSEAEGRESEEIQGLEYAESILENILREQEEGEE